MSAAGGVVRTISPAALILLITPKTKSAELNTLPVHRR